MNRGRALGSLVVASAVAVALLQFGTVLPVRSPHALTPWVDRHGDAALAMALARLAAIAAAIYVALVSALAIGAARHLPRLAPPVVRRLLGIGVAGALALPTAAGALTTAADVPVIVQVEPAPPTTTPPPETPIIVRADDTPATSVAGVATWRVQPGDNFWSIAASTVGDGAATEAVARYWRVLIEANRSRLVVTGDPGLIFAGQELLLPPVG